MVKNLPANAGDAREAGSIPWKRKWQPPTDSCLENPMDKEPGRLQSVQGITELDKTE